MANTFEDYTAQANQLDPSNAAYGFVFNFPYLEDTHVTVEVDGTPLSASNYTIQTSPDKRVLISNGVTVGQKVRVRRNSNADSDNPYVDFVNGSVLNETDQDNAYRHNLYLNEELAALNQQSLQKEVGGTNWDAKNLSIINLPTPTLGNEATSKTYVDSQVATAVNGSPQAPVKYAFTGDGSNAAFTFSPGIALDSDEMYEVAIDGVLQEPTTAYAIDANADTITFTSVPPNASKIVVINRGYTTPVIGSQGPAGPQGPQGPAGPAGSIADGSVTSAKLADGAVTSAKTSLTNLVVNETASVISASAFGGVEVGGPSGGYIDFKSPASDDYDGRLLVGTSTLDIHGKQGVLINTGDPAATTAIKALADGKVRIGGATDPTHALDVTGDLNITGNYKVGGNNLLLDEDAMTSNSATQGATQQSIKAYVDSQVLSKYTADWATSHGGTAVANGASLTITHNLGTTDVQASIFVNSSASDVGAKMPFLESNYGWQVTNLTTNTITVQLGSSGYVDMNSSGAGSLVSYASKYIKVVVIG